MEACLYYFLIHLHFLSASVQYLQKHVRVLMYALWRFCVTPNSGLDYNRFQSYLYCTVLKYHSKMHTNLTQYQHTVTIIAYAACTVFENKTIRIVHFQFV